jgi:hypothetical protein
LDAEGVALGRDDDCLLGKDVVPLSSDDLDALDKVGNKESRVRVVMTEVDSDALVAAAVEVPTDSVVAISVILLAFSLEPLILSLKRV